MAKVALVSHDVRTIRGRAGGVATFVAHFASLLRESGEEVTIILTRQETEPTLVDEKWRARYASQGIGLIEIHNTPPSAERWNDAWPARLSEKVAPLLRDFDIAYFQDWANVAFEAARAKRLRPSGWPAIVTVLHGPSAWIRQANRSYPKIPEDLHLEYIERYSARHSDAVAAPSRYILEWVRRDGWTFASAPEVLGLPYRPPEIAKNSSISPAVTSPGEDANNRLANARGSASALREVVTGARKSERSGDFRQIVFFGRLETRKGFALFRDALRGMGPLPGLERIVLLGHEDEAGAAGRVRRELADLPVLHLGDLDSEGAADYLRAHCGDSLVVIPSPVENFPYAVIEASLIPGLRALYSSGGGVPEMFGDDAAQQLFEPHQAALAGKIREAWSAPEAEGARYDYAAANERWLRFHERVLTGRSAPVSVAVPEARRVDVCVTYFNKAAHFPELLEALASQTVQGFGLIAVDDGSTDARARAVFDEMAAKYAARGWTFFRQANMWVDAARNECARRSRAEFLLFIDADDVPALNTVEQLLAAADASGDDCLLSGGFLIEGESVAARYMPLGPDLNTGLIDPMVFGLPMILIRRVVFESLGGYRTVRGAAHEDWELQVRLLERGYSSGVVPEFLLRFRRLPDGLARTSEDFPAKSRMIDAYQEQLAKVGLHGVARTIHALNRRCQELEKAACEQLPLEAGMRLRERVRKVLSQKPL